MITVAVPTENLRRRLAPQLGDVSVEVWAPGGPQALRGPVDLLVLPYMIPAPELRHLAGSPVRLVQSQTLGFDGVVDHLPPGIVYCNAVGVHEGSTAELALGLVLAMLRGIPKAVRDGDATTWDHARHPGLAGRRVLLLGAGGVGREVERRLAPFGVELDVVARTAREGIHGLDALAGLLPRAEVVIVAVPLSAETRHLVDAAFLAALPDGCLVVNVARGPVVETDALVAELRSGRLRAALDVTDPEPLPPDHPLWTTPGVLVTPHLGGDTDAMDVRVDGIVREQVRRLRDGRPPLNVVVGG